MSGQPPLAPDAAIPGNGRDGPTAALYDLRRTLLFSDGRGSRPSSKACPWTHATSGVTASEFAARGACVFAGWIWAYHFATTT